MECLKSAVMNGADAVYLGGKKFGARHFATNFDYDEMIEAIKFCHLYGVKIYVTVNTICFENEIEEALQYIEFLYYNHVDALIMQDLGLIKCVREKYPNLEIHASTQAHNHNDYGLQALKELGVKRIVLAREMSLDEINNLKTDIDKEVFIHGALCVSYSGCCLFSSMHGGRSGNRGECVGSCRLPYKLYENDNLVKTNGNFILSTKSLCTIDKLDKLLDSDITSLKIEGRMKSKEYVGYITRLYRNKIDEYYENKKLNVTSDEIKNIKALYNRELTNGYLFYQHGLNLMNIKTSNHIGIYLGTVLNVDRKYIKIKLNEDLNQGDGIRFDNDKGLIVNKLYNEKMLLVSKVSKNNIAYIDNKIELKTAKSVRKTIDFELHNEINRVKEKKIPVSLECIAKVGNRLELTINDGKNVITKNGNIVEEAKNCKMDYERIKEQIEKLGNTPFKSVNTNIIMDDNIFISIKELNELRRLLSDELIEKRMYSSNYEIITNELKPIKDNKKDNKLSISMLVRNEKQLQTAISNKIDYIFTDDIKLYNKYKDSNVYLRTKRVFNGEIDYKNENIVASELGAIRKYAKDNNVISDYFLNVVNKYTVNYLKNLGVKKVTLSPELPLENIKLMSSISDTFFYIYGRVELMITKYCPMNMLINNDNKNCNLCMNNKYTLKDQYNNVYPLKNDKHITHILDSKNFNLLDNLRDFINNGITSFRIDLFDENSEEIDNIISLIRDEYGHRNN
jgi:putative protease